MKLIEELARKQLCYQCGTCETACKVGCIEMTRNEGKGLILPKIKNKDKCTKCGLCEKACPFLALELPKEQLECKAFGIYKSSDKKIYENSSSGGAVGSILKYLLDKKIIDRALVTGINGIYAEPIWVYESSEISNIQGSKYQPIALNRALSEVKNEEKIAIVGLPCHISGVERLMQQSLKLRNNIILKIGIFCTIGRGMNATKAVICNKDYYTDEKLCYRDEDHPGNMVFQSKNEKRVLMPHVDFLDKTDYLFYPRGCYYCNDLFNINADISVGDAWGLNYGKAALVLTRTEKGESFLNDMLESNYINKLGDVSQNEALKTQEHAYNFKIKNYKIRYKLGINIVKGLPISINNKNINSDCENIKYKIAIRLLNMNSKVFNSKIGLITVKNRYLSKLSKKYRNFILRNGV